MASPAPVGSDVSAGTYRCTNRDVLTPGRKRRGTTPSWLWIVLAIAVVLSLAALVLR